MSVSTQKAQVDAITPHRYAKRLRGKRDMRSFRHNLITLVAAGILACILPECRGDEEVAFFESRIRPLLIKHCIDCHGPAKQESGLRLDNRGGWINGGDRGPSIVIGKPEQSLLIDAVSYDNADLQMPPERKLSEREIQDLKNWVSSGAPAPETQPATRSQRMTVSEAGDFWSFQPLRRPQVPESPNDDWSRTAVDSFIMARLRQQGLTPVADADRRTLIRRASIDLTGLPPTAKEVQTFLSDDSPDALAQLVERLLASPAYGERWARHWLDVARYADTAGDGADYPVREAVKYRDWVIRAFNRDQPYDEFIRDQIAGDIIARRGPSDLYADRVTATGFLAIGKRYGYKASPDYQHLDFADVIDSVGRSLMGLSIGCARCHDHKYDPISAEDYYALYGIFQSTKWAFPGGEEQKRPAHFPALVPPDKVVEHEQAKQKQLVKLDAQLAELNRDKSLLDPASRAGGPDLDFEGQREGAEPGVPWVSAGPIEITKEAQSPFTHVHPAGKLGIRIGSGQPTDGLRYVFRNGLRATPGKLMHLTVDFRPIAGTGHQGAFRFYLGRGVVQSLAIECSATATEFAVRNGSQWETIRSLTPGTWYTLRISIDPGKKKYSGVIGTRDDQTAFADKRTGPSWDGVADCFICDAFGHKPGPACIRDIDNLGLQYEPFAAVDSPPLKPSPVSADTRQRLAELESAINRLTTQRKKVAAARPYPVAYAVADDKPLNARIQLRGEPHRPGAEVRRRNLEVLGGDTLTDPQSSGRFELAAWITRPSNPLTARVFVNRVWGWHFGHGIVTTPSDFGSRGARPTHPELLDWLTAEFIESGWSVKSLHRLILSSRVWQLASDDHADNFAADPTNQLYWRHSRRPLDAESVRDGMLAISGNLDRSVPQPHPFPPVDSWGFTIHHPFHAVYDSSHRSIYLMVQRNRRHPYLALFDAADPNKSVAGRQPTTTPTQALYLMNSPFVHRQASGFARRIMQSHDDDAARIRWAFETAHGRIPQQSVLDDASRFVSTYHAKLARNDSSNDERLAAWTALARVLLTGNAFLFVD